jgi:hypothetical protein
LMVMASVLQLVVALHYLLKIEIRGHTNCMLSFFYEIKYNKTNERGFYNGIKD